MKPLKYLVIINKIIEEFVCWIICDFIPKERASEMQMCAPMNQRKERKFWGRMSILASIIS